ncbi:MAG: alpha/beta hydrolase [Myxococcota bacterium]
MFIPHHSFIAAGEPAQWMLVLHGIYGRGGNWRTFARKLTERRPQWGLVLVDLRMHGQSQGAPPPHKVTAAAGDLRSLAGALGADGKRVTAVCGHSFGGKVALAYRGLVAQAAGTDVDSLVQTWVLDTSPSARPEAMDEPDNIVARVLTMLGQLPPAFASRAEFVTAVAERGFPRPLGQWLAMNLEPRDGGYALRLDLRAMAALLDDYYRLDAWPLVEDGPGEVRAVVAGQSDAVSAADRDYLDELAAGGAPIYRTTIARSGHWLHIEAPDALLEIVAGDLGGGLQ